MKEAKVRMAGSKDEASKKGEKVKRPSFKAANVNSVSISENARHVFASEPVILL
jgi:hypothetical protein